MTKIGPRESEKKIRRRRRTGRLIAAFLRLLGITLRVRVDDPLGLLRSEPPHIIVIWHNRLAAAPLLYRRLVPRERRNLAMISASGDGEILATAMGSFGIDAARGSSSRGGRAALLACLRALEQKWDVTVTPDGPRGPRYKPHAGIVKLAALSGVPLYPLRVDYSRKWELRTWDRLQIPWPFTRVTVKILQPIRVSEQDGADDVLRRLVEAMGTD
jgi:lysophospholipid acyltransferase (LPLAT)-like uncharacterized protein